MSRIDEALRRAEGNLPDPAPVTGTHRSSTRITLADYSSESAGAQRAHAGLAAVARPLPPSPVAPDPMPAAPVVAAAPVTSARHAPPAPTPLEAREPKPSARSRAWEGRLVTDPRATLVSVEQYRRLAAALHDAQVERGLKTVMITSTVPGEGKTLTIANLGLTLAESYARRVLLIDADLRWPSLHHVFRVPNEVGVSEVLSGDELSPPVVSLGNSLALLTAGRPGPNPLAGLTSERMAALLAECREQFDWVLIDTPPVGLLPDAQLLARLTRSVVFVIAAGSTPAALAERAVAELGPDCVIGTVLNQVDEYTVPEVNYYREYASSGRYAHGQSAEDDEPDDGPSVSTATPDVRRNH